MATGVVKFFNQSKGFGEASGCPPLNDGMKVNFETEADKRGKGPKAVNLSPVADA